MSRKHPKFHSKPAGKASLKVFAVRPEDPPDLDPSNWKIPNEGEVVHFLKLLLLKINTVQMEASYWYFPTSQTLRVATFLEKTVVDTHMTKEEAIYHLQWMIKVYEDPTIPTHFDPEDPAIKRKIDLYRSQDIVLPWGTARFVPPEALREL